MLRVERTEDKIFIKRLSGPDAAGNRHWVIVATLSQGDFVENANGSVTELRYATDSSILENLDKG